METNCNCLYGGIPCFANSHKCICDSALKKECLSTKHDCICKEIPNKKCLSCESSIFRSLINAVRRIII